MKNIQLTRIDKRLIHGQVIIQWCSRMQVDRIVVAHDATADNEVRQKLMDHAVPLGIKTSYVHLDETIDQLNKYENENLFLLCETVQDLMTLIEDGLIIQHVNIGNIASASNKKVITPYVSVNEEEIEMLKKLHQSGIQLEIRYIPSAFSESIEKLFK